MTERVCTYFGVVYFQLLPISPHRDVYFNFCIDYSFIMTLTMLRDDVFRLVCAEYEGVQILGNLEI